MTVMLIDPVIAMLHNQHENRWHPILFELAPLPGSVVSPARYKSKGHHTAGFENRELAIEGAKKLSAQVEGARLFIEEDIEWDGLELPAMVQFFPAPAQVA